jgi:DNA (cytosine-5)-methyltransferase 1
MSVAPLKHGPWNLSDLKDIPKNGYKVFSCFHCGGGSSMGYKLAGFDVLGGVEIDPEIMAIYRKNHNPKHSFLMGVQDFNKIPNEKLPAELFELDILDGSPPCSVFSMAGKREKKWGEAHYFREGQSKQVLDDLFFHFIDTANKLKPKIVVAENVKGLIIGKAKGYVKEIFTAFRAAGYDAQLFLLDASTMGVPQKRERTFFLARRQDLGLPKISLEFQETPITVSQAFRDLTQQQGKKLTEMFCEARKWCVSHGTDEVVDWAEKTQGKTKLWNNKLILPNKIAKTQSSTLRHIHWSDENRLISDLECKRLQAFPDDYDTLQTDIGYLCGMSVPPFMTQRVARAIQIQWLDKL